MVAKTEEEIIKQNIDIVMHAASDFFKAGIAYFANRGHDTYMQRLGKFIWNSVNHILLYPRCTNKNGRTRP